MKKVLITLVAAVSLISFKSNSQGMYEEFTTSGILPAGWSQTSVSPGDQWYFGGGVDFGPTIVINDQSGNAGEYARIDMSNDPDTTSLITPVVDIAGITSPEFSFWFITETSSTSFSPYNRLVVDYWSGTSWVNIMVLDQLTSGWQQFTYDINTMTHSGSLVQVRFSAQEGGAAIGGNGTATFNQDLAIDQVLIGEVPSTCTNTTSAITVSSCGVYTAPSGALMTTTGVYTDIITNAAGCDSVIDIDLTVNLSTSYTQSMSICPGGSVTVGSSTYTSAGTFTDVLTNLAGCDSTVTTTVNMLATTSYAQTIDLCFGESITVGTSVYEVSGTFTDVLINVAGCDSTVTTSLTVAGDIDVTVSPTGSFPTLSVNESSAIYQWIDCNSGTDIVGATGQEFTPSSNGDYAVIVTVGSCSDTSDCVNLNTIGLSEINNNIEVTVFPNPVGDNLNVEMNGASFKSIVIFNAIGQKVKVIVTENVSSTDVDVSELKSGIYFVRVSTESGESSTIKVIKK